MRVAVLKLAGVESVEVSLRAARADVRLRPDNQLSLEQFRQLVKSNGFTLKQIVATAHGTASAVGGKPAIAVSGINTLLHVAPDRGDEAARRKLDDFMAAKKTGTAEVVGVVEVRSDGTEEIAVTSVKEIR